MNGVLVSKLEPRAVLALLGWIAAGTAVIGAAAWSCLCWPRPEALFCFFHHCVALFRGRSCVYRPRSAKSPAACGSLLLQSLLLGAPFLWRFAFERTETSRWAM